MDTNEVVGILNRLADGMAIKITLKSGSVISGVYDGEQSGPDEGLYFETMEGKALRADWVSVTDVGFTSARAAAGKMFAPPEHPLSNTGPQALRPYTTRNR